MDPITMSMMAVGLGQSISGIFQKSRAAKMARDNIRPEYEVNQNTLNNQALAESMASQGLSDSAHQVFQTNADRGLTNSIDAILKSGGNANAIGDSYDSYMQSTSKMALAEDESRFRNFNIFMRANDAVKDEQEKAWQINKYAPWADKAREAAQLANQGTKNMWGGVNTAMSGAIYGQQAKMAATAGVPQISTQVTSGIPREPLSTATNGVTNFATGLAKAPINYTSKGVSVMEGLGIRMLSTGIPSLAAENQAGYGQPDFSQPGFWINH